MQDALDPCCEGKWDIHEFNKYNFSSPDLGLPDLAWEIPGDSGQEPEESRV